MLTRFIGQIRLRRFRPFQTPPKRRPVVAQSDASTPSAVQSEAAVEDPVLFLVGPLQGMRLAQAFAQPEAKNKFISLSIRLDVDVRRQSVRGVCQLPHGLKTDSKLLVFCSDFDAAEMISLGADYAGMAELIQKISKGWTGFDRCIATPAVMPQVMKVAKVLGPKKLMPNPKSGTLVSDLKKAIIESKSGSQLEYRTGESDSVVTVNIGSAEMGLNENLENIKFFVKEVLKQKSRQSSAGGDDSAGAQGKLTTIGGISMIPNVNRLNKLLKKKQSVENVSSGGKRTGFILSATMQCGEDGPVIQLDPEKIMPSSPAYYR
jgi:large subunit ribosomal protein L1